MFNPIFFLISSIAITNAFNAVTVTNFIKNPLSLGKISATKAILLDSSTQKSRSEINELVLELERKNPTRNPAESELMNGVWELMVQESVTEPTLLVYQAVKAIPFKIISASSITLTISSWTQPRVSRVKASSTIKVGDRIAEFKMDFEVLTELEAKSGNRFRETFLAGKLGPVKIPLPDIPNLKRDLVVSYLDDDLLIVRDSLGSPEVLRRLEEAPKEPAIFNDGKKSWFRLLVRLG